MTEEILLLVSVLILLVTVGVYYYTTVNLKKSMEEYERIVKEYKEFINKFYE